MSIEQKLHTPTIRPKTPDVAVKIQPKLLPWIRAGWIFLTLVSLLAFVGVQIISLNFAANPPPSLESSLNAAGVSRQAYFGFLFALVILSYAIFFGVAQLIFIRRANERFAIFAAVFLLAFGTINAYFSAPGYLDVLAAAPVFIFVPYELMNLLAWPLIGFFLVMYPDGQFIPRWTIWLASLHFTISIFWAASPFLPGGQAFLDPSGVFAIALYSIASLIFIGYFYAQLWRYRHHASTSQRQQIKWFVYGLALVLIAVVADFVVELLIRGSENSGAGLWASIFLSIGTFAFVAIPVSVGIAILRYRLWEIDVIIRRTLVYVPLTAILAGIFAASISLTQKFFVSLTGQQSDVATVLTTLLVVAASEPVKSWLQKRVERRFKEIPDADKQWKIYGDQVKTFVQMMDADQSARRLLEVAAAVFDASNGAVYLQKAGLPSLVHTVGEWNNSPQISVPMEQNGNRVGMLELGPRRDGREFNLQDRERLVENSNMVAEAITLVGNSKGAHP